MEQEREHNRSAGEKIFDWVTYSGINGIGTFIITVPVAYALLHGKHKSFYENGTKWLENHGLQMLPERWRTGVAENLLMTTVLMQGGNLMLIPVAGAEHFKVPIVKGLNAMLGDKTDPASIEEAPKQTFSTLLIGRIKAFTTVFVAFGAAGLLFKAPMEKFKNAVGRVFCAFMDRPTHLAGPDPLKPIPTKTFLYGAISAFDVFATAAATVLLYEGSHTAAKKKHAESHGVPQSPPLPAAAPAVDKPATTVSQVERAPKTLAADPARTNALA